MKNPQSQTLFHVSKFETILAILADKGFKTSYCSEEIRHGFNRENKGCISYHYYIPMISFTDMPLSSVPSGDPLVAEMDEIAALVREYEETHYPIKTNWWIELNVFLFDVKYQFRRIRKKLLQSKPTKLNTAL